LNSTTGQFIALGSHECTTLFQSMDLELNIGRYWFIHAVMYYILVTVPLKGWRSSNIKSKFDSGRN